MGLDYILFHCKFTIPIATTLSIFYIPFLSRHDIYKIFTLIAIAVVATIPWDSYLIYTKIWTYPPDTVIGYTLFRIPLEELFFFVIQTYITSVIYCILTKSLIRPIYIRPTQTRQWVKDAGTICLISSAAIGIAFALSSGKMTYLGLILFWVSPVLLFQWLLTFDYLTALPWKVTALPICIPTLCLWVADASAVRAGTWVIEKGTKLDYQIWDGLEIEEAVFFFLTNVMVVGGLIGCDYAFGIEELRRLCAKTDVQKKDIFLKDALLGIFKPLPGTDTAAKDELARAVKRLQAKSESMFLGSALFHGNLRIDLIFLYSFCRVVDDLVDDSGYDKEQARYWIRNCSIALNNRFKNDQTTGGAKFNDPTMALKYNELQSSVDHLPVSRLSREPLHDLLKGFEMDLEFDYTKGCFPIRDEVDLDLYASRVASTIAALILDLVYYYYYHNKPIHPPDHLEHVTKAGKEMGKALQLVNIARDIRRDAAIGRVYIPTSWLRETGLTPIDVIHRPTSADVYRLQERLLEKANICYTAARDTIEELPHSVRGPIRATVDSYMEIGRILREKKGKNLEGAKLSVPLWRRLLVAWSAMLQKKY